MIIGYQTTSHVPEALLRLVESYLALGVVSEAQNAAAVLGYNFPGSKWYEDAFNLLAKHNFIPQFADGNDLIVEEVVVGDGLMIEEADVVIVEGAIAPGELLDQEAGF